MESFLNKSLVLITAAALAGLGGCASDVKKPAPLARPAGVDQPPVAATVASNDTTAKPPAALNSPAVNVPESGGTVARVNDVVVDYATLDAMLIQSYGLNSLVSLMQLQLARRACLDAHVAITPADVENEKKLTLAGIFPDADQADYQRALKQLMEQQKFTESQFEVLMETNANLRKLVTPTIEARINEEAVREQFGITYGEKAKCRHIQLATLTDVAEAKRRLVAGIPFAQVAVEMSRNNKTGPIGGELEAFSRNASFIPEAVRSAAFALKVGEVSDPVSTEGAYHLIKLEAKIDPKAVKYEDVKDVVREDLSRRVVTQKLKEIRDTMTEKIRLDMKIEDPILKKQFADRVDSAKKATVEEEDLKAKIARLEKERIAEAATQSSTAPASSSTSAPSTAAATTSPAPASAPATAPATQP